MEFNYFIGCDVSKNELDFAVIHNKKLLFHKEVPNDPNQVKLFIKGLNSLPGFNFSNTLFCMEHTGIYNNILLKHLYNLNALVCLEAATQIKNSLGNLRGKSDKIDAIRIAEYAYKNREEIRLWKPKREVIEELAYMAATRSRLIEAQKLIKIPLNESKKFVSKSARNINEKLCKTTLMALKNDLDRTEKAIEALIKTDEELRRLFGIITSVKGIGKVTAIQIIISTNEFKNIKDPKKFACYSGVAPFMRESGLFKGKTRVSPMANKKVIMP